MCREQRVKQKKKINLSSVRALRKDDFGEQWAEKITKVETEKRKSKLPFSPVIDMPVNFDAKEFLRKKLIGKKVKINIDYIQPERTIETTGITYPARTCATVNLGDTNIAEALAGRGFVKVIPHGANDDNRSAFYDVLQCAEEKAKNDI